MKDLKHLIVDAFSGPERNCVSLQPKENRVLFKITLHFDIAIYKHETKSKEVCLSCTNLPFALIVLVRWVLDGSKLFLTWIFGFITCYFIIIETIFSGNLS